MIYGRWGNVVAIKRHALIEDVEKLDGRKPDAEDFANLENGCYIVVESDGKERLYALAFLRADDGSREVFAEIDKLGDYPYKDGLPAGVRPRAKKRKGGAS